MKLKHIIIIALLAVVGGIGEARAQSVTPTPKDYTICDIIFVETSDFVRNGDQITPAECTNLRADLQELSVGATDSACIDGRIAESRKISNTHITLIDRGACGGGKSGGGSGSAIAAGVAVGAGIFILSQMADEQGFLPRGFTPEFRFAMNDAKRPAVYIGNIYPLGDNQTLRFGVSEVLNDGGDDFAIAAEWRLAL